jgi:serine/threonine protein kinase
MSLDILIAGKYRLGRKLGGGSFGEIFLGTNLQTGEEVGIKLVRAQYAHGAVVRGSRAGERAHARAHARYRTCALEWRGTSSLECMHDTGDEPRAGSAPRRTARHQAGRRPGFQLVRA